MSQLLIFTTGEGDLIYGENSQPNPFFKTANEYIKDGWRVTSVSGTGVAATYNTRGSFCIVLEKEGKKFPMP